MQPDVHGSCLSAGICHAPKLLHSELQHLSTPIHLTPLPRGSLSNLTAVPVPSLNPGPDQVLLNVQAVGLNFRDVLNVLGMYPGDPGEPGGDCSAVVAAVGANVTHMHK